MDNVEEVITIDMHYIADADGYLQAVSFGAYIACDGVSCVEYVGSVPDGYTSLEAWYAAECECLHKWKVVDYNLVKDDDAPDPVASATRLRTTSDGRGNLQLYNADGGLAVNAYATDKGIGEVDVHGADGVARATLFVTAPTSETPNEGRLVLKNADGASAHLDYEDVKKLENLGGVNLLDNWYFADPINQRGATSYARGIYGIDRWKANSAACLLTVEDGYIKMSKNTDSTSTATQFLAQYLENPQLYAGKTVTLSAIVKGYVNLGAQVDGSSFAVTGYKTYDDFTLPSITFVLPDTLTSFNPFIQTTNGSEWYCKAIKLELGSVSTLANDPPPNKQQELAKCQRYQLVNTTGASQFLRASAITANTIYFNLPTPVNLRTTPVVESYSVLQVWDVGLSTAQDGFSFSVSHLGPTLRIAATKTAHGLTDAMLNAAKVIFNANL